MRIAITLGVAVCSRVRGLCHRPTRPLTLRR